MVGLAAQEIDVVLTDKITGVVNWIVKARRGISIHHGNRRFASLGPPFPPEHQYPLQSLFDCSPLALTGDDLERVALRSLSEIEFVGVTEHLDALYREVAERVWSVDDPPVLERENPSHDRPRRATVSVKLVRRIEEMTVVDHALYEEARRRAPRGRGA